MLVGYTILRTLGQGGAAVVYLARQDSLNREVAVKVLRRDIEDEKMWRYFRREAHTVAQLSGHPNVVSVFNAGKSAAGLPFLVTEYLDRGSLEDVIAADGALPPAAVARIGIAVADALIAAHRLGILHRDVKPGNVLLHHDGRVKLADFGIARLLAGQTLTTTDSIAFTPEHVAPEILRGDPDGEWSDLYGLGSTLATALVGVSPFEKRPEERMEALLARRIMSPAPTLPASVPAALAEPITRALDPDPDRRPSLDEFRRRLVAAADSLGGLPLPTAATAMNAPPTVRAAATPATLQFEPDPPATPLIAPLGRPRVRVLAIPAALAAALLVAVVAVVALAGNGDGGGNDAEGTAAPDVTTPGTDRSDAPPSSLPAPAPTSRDPATRPVVTTSPVVTSAPATDPAPTTTSPPEPTTTQPAPTTTLPPPTTAPTKPQTEASAVVTAPQAETFVRSYYDTVAAGDYEAAWPQLTPEFQQGKAQSYEYYTGFWTDNDVEVGTVEFVEATEDRALVNVELRFNGSDTATTEQFTLRRADGELLIAEQNTLG
ncbi:hypothetical protein BH24ACT6_BH24ACT6_09320 [soil metagenome]